MKYSDVTKKLNNISNDIPVDMLDPTTKQAWIDLMELAEYYQKRCHEAEDLLMDASDPFAFRWWRTRWSKFIKHVQKWEYRLPKLMKMYIDEQ